MMRSNLTGEKLTPEEIRERLIEKVKRFNSLFSSHDGKMVLEDLKQEFGTGLCKTGGDGIQSVLDTWKALGQADVIEYIEMMIRVANREDIPK